VREGGAARESGARGRRWAEGRGGRGREREGGRVGKNRPSREGERNFRFPFCFLFSFSLIPFILYTNIYLCFLGAKMKYYR
jgi:hypothetical protein